MKLRRKIAILLALLILFSLPLVQTAVADLGDISGSSDFGGSSSSSSDDCDGIGWAIYYIFRIGCVIGECAEDAGCSHGQVIVFEVIFFAAALGLLVLFVRLRSRVAEKRNRERVFEAGPVPTAAPTGQSIYNRMRAVDPQFSEQDLMEKLKNLYFRLADCRQRGDLDPIRPYLSDALLARTEAELAAHRAAHVTEHTERLGILDAKLSGYMQRDGSDVLYATLLTRCVRYQQNTETGEIVSGKPDNEMFETVTIELARPVGVVTGQRQTGTDARSCPFCGAPLSLNESNKCPYCDSVLPADRDEWIIRSIMRR